MPPNPSNSKSALSRQMQRLRRQVDQTDRKILRLLQQRTKLSEKIGAMKRRHQADVYVPERERELLARVTRLGRGKLPPSAVTAIYREILSSSRAAQGQAPIGLLRASAAEVKSPARWCFGACDDFQLMARWPAMATGLESGALAVALLTGQDLAEVLHSRREQQAFFDRFAVVGDFAGTDEALAGRIFIVMRRGKGAAAEANRILILIECKSTVNAVKTLLHSMPDRPIHAEQLNLRTRPNHRTTLALVRLAMPQPMDGICAIGQVLTARKAVGFEISILGVYPGQENGG